jgi:hypothetical protein
MVWQSVDRILSSYYNALVWTGHPPNPSTNDVGSEGCGGELFGFAGISPCGD